MRAPPGLTLRGRLVLVALLAVVPILAALVIARDRLVARTEESRTRTVQELAAIAAREHREALRDAAKHFAVLGPFAAQDPGTGPVCGGVLASLHGEEPYYTAVALYRPDGSIVCRHPPGGAFDLSDVPYFAEAVRTGRVAVNDYHLNPDSVARASLAYPVSASDGSVAAVMVGGIDLASVPSLGRTVAAEPGLSLLVLGGDGTILLRLPESPGELGTRADAPLVGAMRSGTETVVDARDPDGTRRRYAVVPLGGGEFGLRSAVAVGFDLDAIGVGILPGATVSLLGLLASGLVMVLGIWGVLEFGFVRRLAPVLDAARRIGDGDLGARSGVHGTDEVGILAETFDDMAEQVQNARLAEAMAARAAIEARDERFELLAETIDEAFWIWDEEAGTTLYLSPGYEKIWARPRQDVLDSPSAWVDTVHPEDREQVRARGLREGVEVYRIVRPDGEVRWVRTRVFAVRNDRGDTIRRIGVAQDITEQRLLEEALVRSSKLEAVGRLAGGVAHDFNNILMAVRGHVQLVQDALQPSSELHDDLNEIDRAALRAERLTRQLLAFGRKQPLSVRSLDLAHAVADTTSMLERLVGEDVTVALELAADTPSVRMDPTHLEQILVNLAVNARDAMPEGGTLRIAVGRAELEADAEGLEAGTYARLEVSDTGAGMSADVLSHLFEPFFTTKDVGKGTGLGLATVYGVVKQANGSIRVESEPGQGARFTIDLPAEQTRTSRETPASRSGPAGRPGADARPHEAEAPLSVLVVEDEGAVRRVTVRSLTHLGYRVFEAEGGREALDLLDREPVDIVLSDVMMPGMTGPQLAAEMRRAGIHVPVLLMSGYPGDDHGRRDRLPILRKPFTREALVTAIHEALAEDPAPDPVRPPRRDPPN